PISARSRVRWAIIASKGSSMTAFTAWVRKRIGTSGAPGTRTIRDGYRMVTAFVRRRLGRPVNRKRVLRVLREHKLIQRRRPLERRKRPGFFRVERPRQLWQLDMTSVWVAEHGWTYLNAIIRLLHPRDRRLAARAPLPRRRSDRRHRTRRHGARHPT